jgi:hypothetical protein
MKFYVKTKLSKNISKTPEGFLLCRNIRLTHTGALRYVHPEHPFGEKYPEVIIKRSPEELFSEATMASFEGKDITIQHPEDFVSPENYQELTHGVLFNIRKSGEQVEVEGEMVDVMLGDALIKSKSAIKLVEEDGEREVSLGYEAAWELISDEEGRHSKIRGNHCAIVSEGRAGKHCAINDHKKEKTFMDLKEKFKKLFGKSLDEAVAEKEKEEEKAKDEAEAKEKEEAEKKAKDEEEKKKKESESEDEDESSDLEKRLEKVEGMLEKLLKKLDGSSEDEDKDKDKNEDEESEEVVEDEDEDEESEDESEGCDEDGSEDELEKEDEKKDKASDTMSRAEILAPGIKKTKDIMSKALATAYKTKDGKKVIDSLTGGKEPSKLPKEGVQAVFVAAAEMMKTKRVNDFAVAKIMTIDSFPALKGTAIKTPEEINKQNAEFYNSKK